MNDQFSAMTVPSIPERVLFLRCRYCTYMTRFTGNLAKHVRTHTGERPYKCMFCTKRFASKSNYNTHLSVHASPSDGLLHCPLAPRCLFAVDRSAAFLRHVKQDHANLMLAHHEEGNEYDMPASWATEMRELTQGDDIKPDFSYLEDFTPRRQNGLLPERSGRTFQTGVATSCWNGQTRNVENANDTNSASQMFGSLMQNNMQLMSIDSILSLAMRNGRPRRRRLSCHSDTNISASATSNGTQMGLRNSFDGDFQAASIGDGFLKGGRLENMRSCESNEDDDVCVIDDLKPTEEELLDHAIAYQTTTSGWNSFNNHRRNSATQNPQFSARKNKISQFRSQPVETRGQNREGGIGNQGGGESWESDQLGDNVESVGRKKGVADRVNESCVSQMKGGVNQGQVCDESGSERSFQLEQEHEVEIQKLNNQQIGNAISGKTQTRTQVNDGFIISKDFNERSLNFGKNSTSVAHSTNSSPLSELPTTADEVTGTDYDDNIKNIDCVSVPSHEIKSTERFFNGEDKTIQKITENLCSDNEYCELEDIIDTSESADTTQRSSERLNDGYLVENCQLDSDYDLECDVDHVNASKSKSAVHYSLVYGATRVESEDMHRTGETLTRPAYKKGSVSQVDGATSALSDESLECSTDRNSPLRQRTDDKSRNRTVDSAIERESAGIESGAELSSDECEKELSNSQVLEAIEDEPQAKQSAGLQAGVKRSSTEIFIDPLHAKRSRLAGDNPLEIQSATEAAESIEHRDVGQDTISSSRPDSRRSTNKEHGSRPESSSRQKSCESPALNFNPRVDLSNEGSSTTEEFQRLNNSDSMNVPERRFHKNESTGHVGSSAAGIGAAAGKGAAAGNGAISGDLPLNCRSNNSNVTCTKNSDSIDLSDMEKNESMSTSESVSSKYKNGESCSDISAGPSGILSAGESSRTPRSSGFSSGLTEGPDGSVMSGVSSDVSCKMALTGKHSVLSNNYHEAQQSANWRRAPERISGASSRSLTLPRQSPELFQKPPAIASGSSAVSGKPTAVRGLSVDSSPRLPVQNNSTTSCRSGKDTGRRFGEEISSDRISNRSPEDCEIIVDEDEEMDPVDRLVREGRLYRCASCNILTPDYAVFVLHIGCHGNGAEFRCHYCGVTFDERFGFLAHFMRCPHQWSS